MDYKKLSRIVDVEDIQQGVGRSAEEVAGLIESKLPELAAAIDKRYGIKTVLTGKLKADRRGSSYYEIESDELLGSAANSAVDRALFSSIRLNTWWGSLKDEDLARGSVYFSLHLEYEHVDGGGNGKELPDGFAMFDVDSASWIIGREEAYKFEQSKKGAVEE